MATIFYPAILERAGEGYSVFFPDLPGCTSAGDTLQEAALNAEEALAGHLAVSLQHGDVLPDPSSLDAIERDPDVDEAGRVLIRGERPGRAVRVQITLDDGLLASIDRVASNRSGFLADAARAALAARYSQQPSSALNFFAETRSTMTEVEEEAVVAREAGFREELVVRKTAEEAVDLTHAEPKRRRDKRPAY